MKGETPTEPLRTEPLRYDSTCLNIHKIISSLEEILSPVRLLQPLDQTDVAEISTPLQNELETILSRLEALRSSIRL